MKITKCEMTFDEFRKSGLCTAGTWFFSEQEVGWSLVGHVNELGGLCDDCHIEGDVLVTAYAQLLTEDLLRLQRELGDVPGGFHTPVLAEIE